MALNDFKTVCKKHPKDKQARGKYKECEKALKEARFAAAIESEETAPFSIDPSSITVIFFSFFSPLRVWPSPAPLAISHGVLHATAACGA